MIGSAEKSRTRIYPICFAAFCLNLFDYIEDLVNLKHAESHRVLTKYNGSHSKKIKIRLNRCSLLGEDYGQQTICEEGSTIWEDDRVFREVKSQYDSIF